MSELWFATLNPSGPHYDSWFQIFGMGRVPLTGPTPVMAELGEERNVPVHLLDLRTLTLAQRAKLLSVVAQKFGAPVYEVEAEIAKKGFPIRAADVIVNYDTRSFV